MFHSVPLISRAFCIVLESCKPRQEIQNAPEIGEDVGCYSWPGIDEMETYGEVSRNPLL